MLQKQNLNIYLCLRSITMILGDNVYKMILGVILQTWSARQLYMGCVVSMDMICNVGDCYMDVLERIEIIVVHRTNM